MRTGVGYKRFLQLSSPAGVRKILDQFCRRGAQGLETILDGAIANGYGQMRFPSAGFALEDQRPSLGDEVRAQVTAEQGVFECTLQSEIELINGL